VGDDLSPAWLPEPSADAVRDAVRRVAPDLAGDEVILNDILETSAPLWQRGTAWLGMAHVVKFCWSASAAAELDRERRVILALAGTSFQRWLPPIAMTSERPLLVITRRVDGAPFVAAVFGDSSAGSPVADLAQALTDLHNPAVLAAVRSAVSDLPAPTPQADTAAIRAGLHRFVEAARVAQIVRWCDWADEIQARAAAGDPVLVHGDLHGYNMVVADGRLVCLLDFDGVAVGDHHFDFRYLPGLERSIRLFVSTAEEYERLSGRTVEPASVLAWHIRTVLGDALWRSQAEVPLPDGGTVDEWVDQLHARIIELAHWRPFDHP
jgi:aminoglycoside phosphotransferase (APT) family kinase protein